MIEKERSRCCFSGARGGAARAGDGTAPARAAVDHSRRGARSAPLNGSELRFTLGRSQSSSCDFHDLEPGQNSRNAC